MFHINKFYLSTIELFVDLLELTMIFRKIIPKKKNI